MIARLNKTFPESERDSSEGPILQRRHFPLNKLLLHKHPERPPQRFWRNLRLNSLCLPLEKGS